MTIETAEQDYLNLIKEIIENGNKRSDRTNTGTYSIFAPNQLKFDLSSLPLLTTKRVFWKGVVEELLFFIRGETNANLLSQKGVKIWEKNASSEYLNSIGLSHREQGDLGRKLKFIFVSSVIRTSICLVYGFQWRHFGADYVDFNTDYTGKGVDQLKDLFDKLINNPTDRRMILSAWNPKDLKLMALPPCHMFCQFYVTLPTEPNQKSKLSCLLYQRSCDVGLGNLWSEDKLGVPFNIASYALFTMLIAHCVDMEPLEFIHTMGDAHIYLNHVDALKVQLQREPRPFPKLIIKTPPGGGLAALEKMTMEDLELVDYNPHGKISMDMAV